MSTQDSTDSSPDEDSTPAGTIKSGFLLKKVHPGTSIILNYLTFIPAGTSETELESSLICAKGKSNARLLLQRIKGALMYL